MKWLVVERQGDHFFHVLEEPLPLSDGLVKAVSGRNGLLHHLSRLGPDESHVGVGVALLFTFRPLGPLEALLAGGF